MSTANNTLPTSASNKDWNQFWFSPYPQANLDQLRLAIGLVTILWLLSFLGNQTTFFGFTGLLDTNAMSEANRAASGISGDELEYRLALSPWSPTYLANPMLINLIYAGSIGAALLLTLGILPEISAVLTWIGVTAFTSNPILLSFTGDSLLLVLNFYLMLSFILRRMPFGLGVDPDSKNSIGANVAIRLLQIHLAILIASAGFAKLQISDWHEGTAFWYPLHPPSILTAERVAQLRQNPSTVASELSYLGVFAYLTLAWQISFPFVAWRRGARTWLLAGAIVGCIGCFWIYHAPFLGLYLLLAILPFLRPAQSHPQTFDFFVVGRGKGGYS